MLQLQNVTKNYTTKAGIVHALDGVSLTFPSSGLVFITGKSGCGKTTLLNVIGGLDGIDGGEIFIQGKKFSAFSAEEYDSYRNTFVGFIFQEYNLLPEFTVEKNIKMAMELQGRETDEAEFEKILKDVEIDSLRTRNPAELSGGQRQRVAIARALVKQPRVIMADEPTGALDSATGIQVLDTLKKLSKQALVIVVSHDNEFAEKYADRIIRLEDGKIAQDVTFSEREIEGNVSEQGDTLVVREGAELTEDEKNAVAKAVKERKGIELVETPYYREKTATGDVEYAAEGAPELKKSQMKFGSAASIGAKALGVKPVRLIFTILISALAFALFGLFDTVATFSESKILRNQLAITPSKTVVATTEYAVDYDGGDTYAVRFSENTVAELQNKTGGTVKGIFDLQDSRDGNIKNSFAVSELSDSSAGVGQKYYARYVNGFVEFDKAKEISADGKFNDFEYTLVAGSYPELTYLDGALNSESVNRVAISTYLADSILHYLNGNTLNGNLMLEREDLLGEKITVGDRQYVIVGLIDCGEIPEKYDALKTVTLYDVATGTLGEDFNAYINSGAHKCLFVADGFLQAVKEETAAVDIFYIGNADWRISVGDEETTAQVDSYVYNAEAFGAENILLFDGNYPQGEKITLANDEVLIHYSNIEKLFAANIAALPSVETRTRVNSLIGSMKKDTAEKHRGTLAEIVSILRIDEQLPITATVHQVSTKTNARQEQQIKIVGVYFGVDTGSYTFYGRYKLMMNRSLMPKMNVFSEQGSYGKLLFSTASIQAGGDKIVEYMVSKSGLTLAWYNNSVLSVIRDNEIMIRQSAELFLYADIALLLFSIFMLYNYMSTSISGKKQSVGILRALGAGGKDVLLIFFTESFIVSLINGVLATVFAWLGCSLVNAYIVEIMNISVHFALFGVRQVLIILAISLLTAIVSSILPIIKISKEKPVELIRRA